MAKPLAEVFTHCPACGAQRKDAGANPFRCANEPCQFVYFFGPITAVGAIVADDKNQILFIRRAKDPGKDKLGLPGGFVDSGERLEIAVAREVKEETNLDVTTSEYLTSFPNLYEYRGTQIPVTDIFFHCRVQSFDGMHAVDGEATGFHLTTPTKADLDDMAFPSNRKALEMYLARGN